MDQLSGSAFECKIEKEDISELARSVSRLLSRSEDAEKMIAEYLCVQKVGSLYIYFPSLGGKDPGDNLSAEHQINRFWKIRFELHEECNESKYRDAVNSFLALDSKYGILEKLEGQMALINEVRGIYSITCQGSPRKTKIREYKLHGALCLHPRMGSIRHCTSLFNPDTVVKEMILREIKIFPSSTFPILVPLNTDKGISRIIYKKGDDLTKDLFVLETIRYISELVEMDLVAYKVIPLSREEGIVEVVDGVDFTQIKGREDLERYIEGENDPRWMQNAQKKRTFVDTLCGYSVACYMMGVGDRNPGNMMVSRDGRFFHVDFSYVFGNDPKLISPRITIARPICDYLVNDELIYQDFIIKSGEVFLQIRRSCQKIFVLWCVLLQNKIFRFDLEEIITFARGRLKMEVTEQRALELFEREVKDAVGSFKTSIMHLVNRVGMFLRR
ncbi:phosphatidyl inositol-3-kinase [Encephalitozoon intestinalis ATCC 50506]|uniref:Phosphatidyl inositol-3-kinase n=1 Tax=Encephalitozoon intestinalis (strain ATCC 50506) TaxID=876142 RepID=E0S9J4_ENCIT|nr:phosphatidyl inositol-3-kinase [Encephalitozoon intestinalis ATCC 50506]ADM12379.1 phosphatidyl inositol-3-kinase [Encephalitozoon intestinalis ATCC 50506]UTX46211.1 phosphatidyl inositol-3-kinase [Encephalitozoon intestinalis]